MQLSVRGRITAASTLLVALIVLAISVLTVRLVENDVRDEANAALTNALQEQAAALENTEDIGSGLEPERAGRPGRQDMETSFQLITDGMVYQLGLFDELSEGNAGGDLTVDGELAAVLEIDLDTNRVVAVFDPGTGAPLDDPELVAELRQLTFLLLEIDGPDGPALLAGAAATEEIESSIAAVRRAIVRTGPLLVVAAAMLTWWLVGLSLRPVRAITSRLQAISTTNLDQRVPTPGGSDEVAQLATVMNQMLERLNAGDARQREFSADASHELRSPLTTVAAAAEMIERDPSGARTGERAAKIQVEARRMDELIGDLLQLSRSSQTSDQGELLDLGKLTEQVGATLQQPIELHGKVVVRGDPGQLRRLVRNLIENAQRHANDEVIVTVAVTGQLACITVEDDGPGVAFEDRARVFERFTRLDESRDRVSGGSGLGLALVKTIVERHAGSVDVDASAELGGARFVAALPSHRDDAG